MNATALTSEQLTELRERARREAGQFIDPRIMREHQDHGGHCTDWATAVAGQPTGLRGWSWEQIYLLHLAHEAEPNPPAPEPIARPWDNAPPPPKPAPAATGPQGTAWAPLYHVPRSQVWEGSDGRQAGHVHLALVSEAAISLTSVSGRRTRISRSQNLPLCGKDSGWYERPPGGGETRCPRCVAFAQRYGIDWPEGAQ